MEDTEADGGTPTPVSSATNSPAPANCEELEMALYELVANEKWSQVISFARQNRSYLSREHEIRQESDDDIAFILNTYCRRLIQERQGMFINNIIN